MIARPDLSKAELQAVVQQVKTFSLLLASERPLATVNVAPQPLRTPALVVNATEINPQK